ncbi:MAG: hypothetical protein ACXVBU_18215, partial [Ktedonobacteraceae bacterium]
MTQEMQETREEEVARVRSYLASQAIRRTPEQLDDLRARMIREGYPLDGVSIQDSNDVWKTLTQRRRWDRLQALTGLD